MTETPIRRKLLSTRNTLSIPASPLMQKLGYGTGVTVYKFERPQNRSPWVLKKLTRKGLRNEELNTRLKFEANILRKLKHPNIVGFRAFLQESDGRKCIAMEDCSISLGDLIEAKVEEGINHPFSVNRIERVLKDVARGLEYLHHVALVLHCDIKSYNILVKNNFQICKLCDFGVSMPLKSDGSLDNKRAGDEPEYVGTQPWCPPEILKIGQIITVKADIFAYGLCIYEMIALEPPYSNTDDSLDASLDKENGSNIHDACLETLRERPKIPTDDLTENYLPVLQVFTLCTEQDYTKRPNAKDLCLILKDLKFSDDEDEVIDLTDLK